MSSTHEDGFREIQLSGKQLVFYCMAALVFIVVVFLMGVQVGRGVLAQRGLPGTGDSGAFARESEPPPAPASVSQGSTPPVTAGEKLSYAERLSSPEPPTERLKKVEEPPPTRKVEAPAPAPAAARANPIESRRDSATPSGEPAGPGFEIQVGALRERGLADSIAKRLVAKGYPAYVVAPAKGTPDPFRVRVGKYKDRREADTVAAKLQKEEQFKPWVVR
jgi:cell division septation protein DedD